MNIALPALIVFLICVPGFLIRTGIRRVRSKPLDDSPLSTSVMESLLFAFFLHFLWLVVTWFFFDRYLDREALLGLFSIERNTQKEALSAVAKSSNDIAIYFVTLFSFSLLLPKFVRFIVDRYKLDSINSSFRGLFRFDDADWHYLFSKTDFKKSEEPEFFLISAVVEVGKEAYLYLGILDSFFLDKSGDLDRIVLKGASRRKLSEDKDDNDPGKDRFYPIDGEYLVLRYADILSINIKNFMGNNSNKIAKKTFKRKLAIRTIAALRKIK